MNWVPPGDVPSAAAWTGALGMTFLPGKRDVGTAGRHWRDLADDVARLRDTEHVDTFVLLVEDHELVQTGASGVADAMAAKGINLVRFPITDGNAPPTNDADFRHLIDAVIQGLRSDARIVVACRGGLGRTGTVVACLLREAGLNANSAVALTRRVRHHTIESDEQELFVREWEPTVAAAGGLPFARYEGAGRRRLGRPRQGDLTARHGYGPPVFDQCGYQCVYCGLDMRATFENWLQLSVDHVVPRQMVKAGYAADLIEDITNLATCCRACNDLGNQFVVTDAPPTTDARLYSLRDRVFTERRTMILAKREQERAIFANLPAAGPDRPSVAGESV